MTPSSTPSPISPNQIRRPTRPKLRLPAVTWALPGTTRVISRRVTARRDRIAGVSDAGSRSGWVVGRYDPSGASGRGGRGRVLVVLIGRQYPPPPWIHPPSSSLACPHSQDLPSSSPAGGDPPQRVRR